MRRLHDSSRRRGFTMLEMLVAVAISVIVVAGLYALFVTQSRQFMYQDIRMNMQQNLRFAGDTISRSGRMAGYGTGGAVAGVMGYSGSIDDASTLPAVISSDAWNGASDAVTFVYADPSVEMMTTVSTLEDCGTSEIAFDMTRAGYSTTITQYESGELLMCWDYAPINSTLGYIWEINADGDATAGTIGVASNTTYTDYASECQGNLPAIMHCSRASVVTFYIDETDDGVGPGSPDHPVLMMDIDFDFLDGSPDADDIPLVDDIEDLQIEYCAAGENCTTAAVWDDSLTVAEGAEAWMMRFHLVARSSKEDVRGLQTMQPYSFANRSRVTEGTDHYWRQAMTSAVSFQNLRLAYAP
jgi:prepilin-type N-terminal cleavage/methylation domain-containing protein